MLGCFVGKTAVYAARLASKLKLQLLGIGSQGINCLEVARRTKKVNNYVFFDDGYEGQSICNCTVIGERRHFEV